MAFKTKASIIAMCLALGSIGLSSSLSRALESNPAEKIKTLTDLMTNGSTKESIKNVMTISDAEYDGLRQLVLKTLVKDRLIGADEYTFDQIGLGFDQGRLFIESKKGLPLALYVSDGAVEIKHYSGGEKFKKAFERYIISYGSPMKVNLAYVMAALQEDRLPLEIDLDEYEKFHNEGTVHHGVVESGANKGMEWAELHFLKKISDEESKKAQKRSALSFNSPKQITIDSYGRVQFYPAIKVGVLKKSSARGSCMRRTWLSSEAECVDNVDEASCKNESAFKSPVRCCVRLIWNQNLSCHNSQILNQ